MVITDEQRAAVSRAVARAESGTTAEIVPVLARQSDRYDRAEALVGLVFALLALVVVWFAFQRGEAVEGPWDTEVSPVVRLVGLLIAVVVGFAVGALLAARVPLVRRPFIRRAEMEAHVERAALEAFYRLRVYRTAGRTGLVIYVSLYERVVRIAGDDEISAVLLPDDWAGVRDHVLAQVRSRAVADGLIAGIEAAGVLLQKHFPSETDGPDELHNTLHVV